MSIVDLATLRHLYIDEQLSIRNVAALLHVNPRTVHSAMIRGRIPRRKQWEQPATAAAARATQYQIDEAQLRQLYVLEWHSIREIADIFNTCPSTVQHALVRWNIPRRKRGRPKKSGQLLAACEDQG